MYLHIQNWALLIKHILLNLCITENVHPQINEEGNVQDLKIQGQRSHVAHVMSSENGKARVEDSFVPYDYVCNRLFSSLVAPPTFFLIFGFERTFSVSIFCFNNPVLFTKLHIYKIILKWFSLQKDPSVNKEHYVNNHISVFKFQV